jgi:hypothetical protein
MEDVVNRRTGDLINDQKNAFEAYGEAATARAIEGDLLKFVQGEFLAGQENRVIPLETRLVARMDTVAIGWLCWQDNVPVEERMGLLAEDFVPVKRPELGDLDKEHWETDAEGHPRDPWQFSNRLVAHDPESGEVFTFATTSNGGRTAVGQLCKDYGRAKRQYPDQYPIIELGADSYQHRDKSIGRVKVPVFKLVGWTDKNGPNGAALAPTEPPKSPSSDDGGAAAKPALPLAKSTTTRKPAAQPRF